MAKRTHVLFGAVFLALVCLAPNPSIAANAWYKVKVLSTGVTNTGRLSVLMTDRAPSPAFTNRWFQVPAINTNRKELLATLLVAVSLDAEAFAYTDGTINYGAELIHFYVCSGTCPFSF